MLSADEVHYLLKLYAGWVGLKAKEIMYHTLRHTAATVAPLPIRLVKTVTKGVRL